MNRLALIPPFSFDRVESDEVEGDVFEQGQVVCGKACRFEKETPVSRESRVLFHA